MMGHGFGMGSGRTWGKDGRGGMSTDVFRWGLGEGTTGGVVGTRIRDENCQSGERGLERNLGGKHG